METEAVFTKTKMNTEWNVKFNQNMNCAQRASGLKLYLPMQKKEKKNELNVIFLQYASYL